MAEKTNSNTNTEVNVTKSKNNTRIENVKQLKNITLKTFHYNPSRDLVEHLTYFATLHKYDDRVAYKEAWDIWVKTPEIASLLALELEMLQTQGYLGDAMSKIYKSARYYYRKKTVKENDGQTKKRKKYEGLTPTILETMDTHIATMIKTHIATITCNAENGNQVTTVSKISPANAFKMYLETLNNSSTFTDEIMKKYKKTYKNRFFLYRKDIVVNLDN